MNIKKYKDAEHINLISQNGYEITNIKY